MHNRTLYDARGWMLVDPEPLPASRADALTVRSLHYATGRPCARGHVAARHTQSGNCLACQREQVTPDRSLSLAREARAVAQLTGANVYIGRPCKHAHSGERYTKSGACVACIKETAAIARATKPRKESFAEMCKRRGITFTEED
jgi:hypothetical protein